MTKKEQQDELWNNLSEDQRKEYQDIYKHDLKLITEGPSGYTLPKAEGRFEILVSLFGEHNLDPKPPTPKTWEDINKTEDSTDILLINTLEKYPQTPILKKAIATLKIYKLIDLGYGGVMNEEEWWNDHTLKYYIRCNPHKDEPSIECVYHASVKYFIAFRTQQLAEEFMSYESNRKLVEQYYMMT